MIQEEEIHENREESSDTSAAETAWKTVDTIRESASSIEARIERAARDRPLRTVLIAAGVGAVAGMCMGGRRRNRSKS